MNNFDKYSPGVRCSAVVLSILVIAFLSWAICVGLVWLVCLCFSLEFNILVATGIWLVLLILRQFLTG